MTASHSMVLDPYELMLTCRALKIPLLGDLTMLKHKLYLSIHQLPPSDPLPLRVSRTYLRRFLARLGQGSNSGLSLAELDFYTQTPINLIPGVFRFRLDSGHVADLRSLRLYWNGLHQTKWTNPYTGVALTPAETDRFKTLVRWLNKYRFELIFADLGAIDLESDIVQQTINVCAKINVHLYIDRNWFLHLSVAMLRQLYHELHDLWIYRLGLTPLDKRRLMGNLEVCPDVERIRAYSDDQALEPLQRELLKELDQLVTLAKDMGAHYVICALVLVCPAAAAAHPGIYNEVRYET
jgi:hypothetical protein